MQEYTVTNYQEASELLGTRDSKKLENNTYLKRYDDYIGVMLHTTDVVKFYPEYFELDSGGWNTQTTRDRINKYSNARVWVKNSVMYVGIPYKEGCSYHPESSVLFYDGIHYDYEGNLLSKTKDIDKHNREVRDMKKKIKKFVDYCLSVAKSEGGVPHPSGGDCWFCLMVNKENKTMGDVEESHQHLINHMEENYCVPSLILNALLENGHTQQQLGYIWNSEWHIKNALTKYMQRRLLPKP